jgi:hypothetical protein
LIILRKWGILKIERRSTRSQSVENSLWKRLWTCHKTDYVIMRHGDFANEELSVQGLLSNVYKKDIFPRKNMGSWSYSCIAS